jgi:hypothetical protein
MLANCEVWVLEDLLLIVKLIQSGSFVGLVKDVGSSIITTAYALASVEAQKAALEI